MHFRDVIGTADDFRETWQDNGQTDMAEAMRAYREVGFDGPIRPDHVPQMLGEEDGEPGYTMLGRLFAYGYIRAMMHATEGARQRASANRAATGALCLTVHLLALEADEARVRAGLSTIVRRPPPSGCQSLRLPQEMAPRMLEPAAVTMQRPEHRDAYRCAL